MANLTPEQISKLLEILRDGSNALAVTTSGSEAQLTDEEIQRLKDQGYLVETDGSVVIDSFALGQRMARDADAKKLSYKELSEKLRKNPIAQTAQEKQALEIAQRRAGMYCVNLGSRYSQTLGQYLIESDQELADRTRGQIQDSVAAKIELRETRKQLTSRLKDLTRDWGRDWERIAVTESHMAHQEGFFRSAIARKKDGDALFAKIPEPDACDHCKRLYLGPDGKPIVKPAGWWDANGVSNAGRKAADWKAVLGAIHPHCFCQLVEVPQGWGFDEDGDLVPLEVDVDPEDFEDEDLGKSETISKSGGPFIGPRGGKWADPKHTIPWVAPKHTSERPKVGDRYSIKVPAKIFGKAVEGTYRVVHVDDQHVKIAQHEGSDYGPTMPIESLKHFKNDLEGRVDLPKSGRKEIDAVIDGSAKLLGKGDDGIAFKVGDQVVKVSTTVPFQPDNPGHRSPKQASDMLRRQVETANKLSDLGVKGVQRSEFMEHGDKGFQIKPWVEIPEKFTREQLDKIQDIVLEIHSHGYALHDTVQAGIDRHGDPVLFDVGKASPMETKTGRFSDANSDFGNLKSLYSDSGEVFVKRGVSEGEEAFTQLDARWNKMISKNPPVGFLRMNFDRVESKLLKEANATLKGSALKERLAEIDDQLWAMRAELEVLEEDAAKKDIAKADTDHKLAYQTEFQGFRISVENRKGSYRYWRDRETGLEGKTKMIFPYGRIPRSVGADGDAVDVYLGDDESAKKVYVVHQMKVPAFTEYDEDKAMIGFPSAKAAKTAYLAHYDNPKFFGSMTAIPVERFRKKVFSAKGRMIKAQLTLDSIIQPINDPEVWKKALDRLGIPIERFPMIVKYAKLGHAEARKALDAVQDLVKAGFPIEHPSNRPETVGTMGNYGKPARTLGENVRSANAGEPRDDWPPKRKRKGRKKRNLQRAAEKLDVRGLRGGDADGWVRPIGLENVTMHADRENRGTEARARVDREIESRREMRAAGKLKEIHR